MAKAKILRFFQFLLVQDETIILTLGRILSNNQWSTNSDNLNGYGSKIFDQFGAPHLFQYLIKHITLDGPTFLEFEVDNCQESYILHSDHG